MQYICDNSSELPFVFPFDFLKEQHTTYSKRFRPKYWFYGMVLWKEIQWVSSMASLHEVWSLQKFSPYTFDSDTYINSNWYIPRLVSWTSISAELCFQMGS